MIKEFSEKQLAEIVELIDDHKEVFMDVQAWCDKDDHQAMYDVWLNKPRLIILLKEVLGVYDE